jgi:hypothetical protein
LLAEYQQWPQHLVGYLIKKTLGNPEFWLCVPMGQDGVKMVNKTAVQNLLLFDLKHILHNHFGNWVASGGKGLWLNTQEILVFQVVR